jgi:hypothetical protein
MEDRDSLPEGIGYECVDWIKLAQDTFQWQDNNKYKYASRWVFEQITNCGTFKRTLRHDCPGRQLCPLHVQTFC